MSALVSCPGGTVLLGGGGRVTNNLGARLGYQTVMTESYPSSATQWTVVGVSTVALLALQTMTVEAFAVCGNP